MRIVTDIHLEFLHLSSQRWCFFLWFLPWIGEDELAAVAGNLSWCLVLKFWDTAKRA